MRTLWGIILHGLKTNNCTFKWRYVIIAYLFQMDICDHSLSVNKGSELLAEGQLLEVLYQTHGVLNAVSWGILMPLGAVIARYLKVFKYADLAWFYLHVTCQLAAYIVGVAGWEVTWLVLHIQLIEHSGSSSSALEPFRFHPWALHKKWRSKPHKRDSRNFKPEFVYGLPITEES